MSTPIRLRILSIVAPTLVVFACGGNKSEPAAPATPAAETTPDAGETSASADAGGGALAMPASAEDAGAPAPKPPAQPVVMEQKDECTPVGVDFEKRARPKLKECYVNAKKKSPNLEGTVKIKITVDAKGKIKASKVVEKTLPDAVADCMLKVVKATPFPEVDKCWDSTITIPITFPTPK